MRQQTKREIARLRRGIRIAIKAGDPWLAARLHRLLLILEIWGY